MADNGQMMTTKLAREQLNFFRGQLLSKPEDPQVIQNVASCLFTLGQCDEAVELFKQALKYASEMPCASSNPLEVLANRTQISVNYAMVLKDLGRFSESAQWARRAFQDEPDHFYLKLGWTESLLRNGNWRDAWPLYDEARPGTKIAAREMLGIPPHVPEWKGQRLYPPENRLLVVGEGGTGDRVTYSRWLPELYKLGIEWAYFPDANPPIPGLMSLFERVQWLTGRTRKVGEYCTYDYWTTVFSLPACFDAIPTTIPKFPGWFEPDPELKKRFTITKPEGDTRPIYGLIWGANELFEGGMKFRSLLESQAMRLVMQTCDLCHWVNCWMGDAHANNFKLGQPVLNPKFENWEETAALLSNMDGVVTTDNGAGWLAQALGLHCSVLLSGNSDWKFLRGTDKSYWSDRARLFRNVGQGFEDAVTKCIVAIRNGEGVGRK